MSSFIERNPDFAIEVARALFKAGHQGPGFYDEDGVRVCSLHPDAMAWFLEQLGYTRIASPSDFGNLSDEFIANYAETHRSDSER